MREVKKPFQNFSSTIFLLTPFIPALSNLFSPTSAFSSSWIGIPGILLPLKMSTHSTRFPPLFHFYFITRYREWSRSVARVKWPKTEERKKKKSACTRFNNKIFFKRYIIWYYIFCFSSNKISVKIIFLLLKNLSLFLNLEVTPLGFDHGPSSSSSLPPPPPPVARSLDQFSSNLRGSDRASSKTVLLKGVKSWRRKGKKPKREGEGWTFSL